MTQSIVFSYEQLPGLAKKIKKALEGYSIVALHGPLGAGKTSLVKELLREYGVKEDILSPTFTYMNLYRNEEGKTFIHFDLYRIKTVEDFLMAGFDEYLIVPNSLVFIEWPEIIEPLLEKRKNEVCKIFLDYQNNNCRILKI